MNKGIDVSTYQGYIHWEKVKSAGVNFAMIKATQGKSESDPTLVNFTDYQFKNNIENASNNGIRCGVYHYLTADSLEKAKEEADYFLKVISPYKDKINMYAAVDVESMYLPNDKELLTKIVRAFCEKIKNNGYTPMVYANQSFLKERLNDSELEKYPLWLALWRNKDNVPKVEDYPNIRLWQWGYDYVPGISVDVDENFEIVGKAVEKQPDKPKEPDKNKRKYDYSTTAEWAKSAMKFCVENGLIIGNENGDLMPKEPMTREQAAVVVERLFKLMKAM